jgi:hypothetical protein
LDDDAGGRLIDSSGQILWLYDTIGCADSDQFDAKVFEVRGDRLAILGVHARGGDDFAVSLRAADGHQHGFGRCAAAVVKAGVRNVETGETRDQRLVLKDDLEIALADFGLIRRVGGVELTASCELVDGGGDEVVVAAAAEETDFGVRVFVLCRQRGHVLREFDFGHRGRNCKGALEAHLGRDHCEKVVDRTGADRGEHGGFVFGSYIEIRHRA